jgi:hypothetical protein
LKYSATSAFATPAPPSRPSERDYFGNGQLHIVNADTGELIGRKDAYIPMNMYLDGEGAAAELAHWKALAEQRREASMQQRCEHSDDADENADDGGQERKPDVSQR